MRRLLQIACAAALAAACGCASVEVSHDFNGVKVDGREKPVAVVAVSNSGWYLFGVVPVIAGDPDYPRSIRFFSDTVTLDNNVKMLADTARKEGAPNIANLTSRVRDDLAIGLFIFGRKMVFTSAVITK